MFFIPRHDILFLPLISIFIMLTGLCIGGCDDSDDNEILIDEEMEPLVATIIDGWRSQPKRSDAEILADKILQRETEDFFFDIFQRNQLIEEIERVLSLIRAAYLPMNEIHAEEDSNPGLLVVHLEQDFYEIVENIIQDKQGPFRFETGNADFDALNAKLGVQVVKLGSARSRSLTFLFDERLNLKVASEAYSMVEGVERAYSNRPLGIGKSADIKAFKQGQTWYVIFRNAWGDCPSGCGFQELFCFTVTGMDVARIPTTQAQTMPLFQELDSTQRDWLLHDDTPFFNAPVYTWSWSNSQFTEPNIIFAGWGLGCSLFGEIEATPNQLRVSCGYRVAEPLPRLAKHHEAGNEIEDRVLDKFEFTGVVLLLIAMQHRTLLGQDETYSIVIASEPVRSVKTAAEVQNSENVFFENVTVPINPPAPSGQFERWWGGIHPTFIVCWDKPQTGERAYQFLRPDIKYADTYEIRNHPGCDNFKNRDYIQILNVYLPLLDIHATSMGVRSGMEVIPDPDNWTAWIDEVLPRPPAPEAVD